MALQLSVRACDPHQHLPSDRVNGVRNTAWSLPGAISAELPRVGQAPITSNRTLGRWLDVTDAYGYHAAVEERRWQNCQTQADIVRSHAAGLVMQPRSCGVKWGAHES